MHYFGQYKSQHQVDGICGEKANQKNLNTSCIVNRINLNKILNFVVQVRGPLVIRAGQIEQELKQVNNQTITNNRIDLEI